MSFSIRSEFDLKVHILVGKMWKVLRVRPKHAGICCSSVRFTLCNRRRCLYQASLLPLLVVNFIFTSVGAVCRPLNQDQFPLITELPVPAYVKVVDYTGRGPVTLTTNGPLTPDPDKPIVIVLADEIILGDQKFDFCTGSAPRQVVLIADTIRITGNAQFMLSQVVKVGPAPPVCFSPYLKPSSPPQPPPIIAALPPVLSIISRHLIVSKNGRACVICPSEDQSSGFGYGVGVSFGYGVGYIPGVETASKVTFTIATEKIDMVAKADMFIDGIRLILATDHEYKDKPLPNGAFEEIALSLLGVDSKSESADKLRASDWAKPYLASIAARPANTPFREEDITLIHSFLRKAFEESPDSAILSALTSLFVKYKDSSGKLLVHFLGGNYYNEDAVIVRDLSQSGRSDPHALRAVSLWTVHTAQKLYRELADADRKGRKEEVLRLLLRFAMTRSVLRPEHQKAYDQAVNAIIAVRDRYGKNVWRRPVQVNAPGMPQAIYIFSEGITVDTYLAPTTALVTTRKSGSKEVIGFVRKDPSNQERIQLAFDAELTLDPLLAQLATEKLSKEGQTVAGMFSNWKLSAPRIHNPDVAAYNVSIIGNRIQVTLTLDAGAGNLALWRLGQEAGLPLSLTYECNADKNVTGEILVPLSLALRSKTQVIVKDGALVNSGTAAATVSYFMLDDKVIALSQPLEIAPDPTKPVRLPLPEWIDLAKANISIPPEAVVLTGRDAFSLAEFYVSQGGELLQVVEVQNLLSVY
jgi:hypothetical protein